MYVNRTPFSNPVAPLLALIRRGPQRRRAISPPASPVPCDQVRPQSGCLHAVLPGPLDAAPPRQSADPVLEPLLQSMHDSFDYLYHICAMHQERLNALGAPVPQQAPPSCSFAPPTATTYWHTPHALSSQSSPFSLHSYVFHTARRVEN
jgi:hypothetical protein